MIDGSETRKRQLVFELQSSRVYEKRSKTTGRRFEYYKSISLLTILFFFFFISLVGRLRNQIGRIIIIERSDIKNQRLSTMQEKRGASRQTNK